MQNAVQRYSFFLTKPNIISIFAHKTIYMVKNLINKVALPLMYAGVILLIALFIFDLTKYSVLLFLALIIELSGTAFYIYNLKKKSKY